MTVTNLTVTDKGETIEARYCIRTDEGIANVEQQISREKLMDSVRIFGNTLHGIVEDYLNQNLK